MSVCYGSQMIARIHTKVRAVREMIHKLLVNIGRHHPQVRGILTLTLTLTINLTLTLTLTLALILSLAPALNLPLTLTAAHHDATEKRIYSGGCC